jgi:hypothetical protein
MWGGGREAAAAAQLQRGRAEVVQGGHFFPMENPDATIDRILPFLREQE